MDGSLQFVRATIEVWKSQEDYKVYEVTDAQAYEALNLASEESDDTIASQVEANPDAFRLLSAENGDPMQEDNPYNLAYSEYQPQAWKAMDEEQCCLTTDDLYIDWLQQGKIGDGDGRF